MAADRVRLQMQHMLPKVVAAVSRMEVVNPEVLRVTTAKEALHFCGRALRGSEREFFHRQRHTPFWYMRAIRCICVCMYSIYSI